MEKVKLGSLKILDALLTIYKIWGKSKSLECTWFLGFSSLLVGCYVIQYILFCEYVQQACIVQWFS